MKRFFTFSLAFLSLLFFSTALSAQITVNSVTASPQRICDGGNGNKTVAIINLDLVGVDGTIAAALNPANASINMEINGANSPVTITAGAGQIFTIVADAANGVAGKHDVEITITHAAGVSGNGFSSGVAQDVNDYVVLGDPLVGTIAAFSSSLGAGDVDGQIQEGETEVFRANVCYLSGSSMFQWNVNGTDVNPPIMPGNSTGTTTIEVNANAKNKIDVSASVGALSDMKDADTDLSITNTDESGGMSETFAIQLVVTGNVCDNGATSNTGSLGGITALPIDLRFFRGDYQGSDIQLQWGTQSEQNNDFFSLERSSNGIDFVEIAKVDGAGDSHDLTVYTYNDELLETDKNAIYYRLRQTDFDGKFDYSNIIVVNLINEDKFEVASMYYDTQVASISINVPDDRKITSTIYDLNGKAYIGKVDQAIKGVNTIILDIDHLPNGFYLLNLTDGQNQVTEKFFK